MLNLPTPFPNCYQPSHRDEFNKVAHLPNFRPIAASPLTPHHRLRRSFLQDRLSPYDFRHRRFRLSMQTASTFAYLPAHRQSMLTRS
jgi:hypothetical protein